jgi:hypothetical protein
VRRKSGGSEEAVKRQCMRYGLNRIQKNLRLGSIVVQVIRDRVKKIMLQIMSWGPEESNEIWWQH